jgi:hypothetical protein
VAGVGLHYAMDELKVVQSFHPRVRIRKDPQDKDYDLHVHVPSTSEVLHVSTRISEQNNQFVLDSQETCLCRAVAL